MIGIVLCLVFGSISIYGNPVELDIPAVEPEYLSALLKEGNYEEFSALLNIPDPELAKERKMETPSELAREEAMYHENLIQGDIVPYIKSFDENRQAIIFEKYGGSKWQTMQVPYVINTDRRNNFTVDQENVIKRAIDRWNAQLGDCIRLVERTNEVDYVFIFSGGGCWSYLGRVGKQQAMSLQYNGCLYQGTILHEFEHAIGFHHEQNRLDRDDYLEMHWDNIPDNWKSQYEKTNPRYYHDIQKYDYLSIMHYPVRAPGTGKKAFSVKDKSVNEGRVGRSNDFTQEDLQKIREVYGCNRR